MEIMRKVGCRPPYWEHLDIFPNCSSNLQLKNISKKKYYHMNKRIRVSMLIYYININILYILNKGQHNKFFDILFFIISTYPGH